MRHSTLFLNLYSKITEEELIENNVLDEHVTLAIQHMNEVYQADPKILSRSSNVTVDFNKVAYQCAYMHKYAPIHTALVYEVMSLALEHNPSLLPTILNSIKRPFKICSLGGGPGTDVIGALMAMHDKFGFFLSSVKLIDIISGWEKTFQSLVKELRTKNRDYGILSESVKYFEWSFVTADLQSEEILELDKDLGQADLITLVKFVSAAACKETFKMIEKIFRLMKPGALVLFIDNAGGGFQKLIFNAASKYKFVPVFGPLNHELYVNNTLKQEKFGYKSCYQTKVSVEFLIKKSNLSQFQNNSSLALPHRYWPKHEWELGNMNVSCSKSYLSPISSGYRFQNECDSGHYSNTWEENDSLELRNKFIQKEPFGSESTINLSNSYIPSDSFELLDYESKPRNFCVTLEKDSRNIKPLFSDSDDSFNCYHSPLSYRYGPQHTFETENANKDYLVFQRKPFKDESPMNNSFASTHNYYSSPDSFNYRRQDESKIQNISMSQIEDYSAFRGKSVGYNTPTRPYLLPTPSRSVLYHKPEVENINICQEDKYCSEFISRLSEHESFKNENLTSTPRARGYLRTQCRNRNRKPLKEIDNIIIESKPYLQSPGPIRNRNITIQRKQKNEKPY